MHNKNLITKTLTMISKYRNAAAPTTPPEEHSIPNNESTHLMPEELHDMHDDFEKLKKRMTSTERVTVLKRFNIWLSGNLFVVCLLAGVILGIVLGVALRQRSTPWSVRERHYLKFPAEIYLRMLRMIILPMIFASLISSMATLDIAASSRIGLFAVIYYTSTTILAAIVGITCVLLIRPGQDGKPEKKQGDTREVSPVDALLDIIRNCFTDNIVAAAFSKVYTLYTPANITAGINESMAIKTNYGDQNLFGIIIFSIWMGIVIGTMGQKGIILITFFGALDAACMKMVRLIVWLTPGGIVFLIAEKVISMENPVDVLARLAFHIVTVVTGILIHATILLPSIYAIFVRKKPHIYMKNMSQALLTAMSTSSSVVTLPVSLYCCENIAGIDRRITRFVLPIGATINMDGTALYESVTALFVAQMEGINLTAGKVVTVSLAAMAASTGAAGIPEAGMVTTMMVLSATGLPIDYIPLLLTVDWILDRLRTVTNVWGDCVGTAVIENYTKKELDKLDAIAVTEPNDSAV